MKMYLPHEKEIFINHFVLHGKGSKVAFIDYLEAYIKENGRQVNFEIPHPNGREIYGHLSNWEYNSRNIVWDNDDNVVTHILKHPKFQPTGTMLGDLKKLQPDWNYQDNEGNNVLHLFALKGNAPMIKKALEDVPVNPNTHNNLGLPFTLLLLKGFKNTIHQLGEKYFLAKELVYLKSIAQLWEQFPQHLYHVSPEQLYMLDSDIKQARTDLGVHCNNYKKLMNQLTVNTLEEHFTTLETTVSYYRLNQQLPIKHATPRKKI